MVLSPIMTISPHSSESLKPITWDISFTDAFDKEGLMHVRDDHPSALIEVLAPIGPHALFCAVAELVSHHNIEKAAIVAREYNKIDGSLELLMKDLFGETETSSLLSANILNLGKIITQIKAGQI
jgi:hypothetical protein